MRLQEIWTDRRTDRRTGWFLYTPHKLVCGGYNYLGKGEFCLFWFISKLCLYLCQHLLGLTEAALFDRRVIKTKQEYVTLKKPFNPFPHTTILQQTTLNIFCRIMENLYNWMDNLWLKVENIVAKGEMARFVQSLLLLLCFQKAVCCRGERVYMRERVNN